VADLAELLGKAASDLRTLLTGWQSTLHAPRGVGRRSGVCFGRVRS
jgi:hypothetical protein